MTDPDHTQWTDTLPFSQHGLLTSYVYPLSLSSSSRVRIFFLFTIIRGFTHIIFVEGRNHATRHIHICSHPFFVKGQGELVTAIRKRHHDGTTAARSGNGRRSSRTGRDGGTVARVTTPLGSGGRGDGTTIGRNKDGNKYIINHVV